MITQFDDFRKLKQHEILAEILTFLAIVAPGILTICLYDMELPIELSTTKLLLIATSITLPSTVFNTALFFAAPTKNGSERGLFLPFLSGCVVTCGTFYCTILFSFFFHFPRSTFVVFVIALNTFVMTGLIFQAWLESKSSKVPTDETDSTNN